MSHLHFTATEEYKNRVIQLGEQPDRVFNVGAIGIDNIINMMLFSKEEFEQSIDFKLGKKNVLVTFHPVTLENRSSMSQFANLLEALGQMPELHSPSLLKTLEEMQKILSQYLMMWKLFGLTYERKNKLLQQ